MRYSEIRFFGVIVFLLSTSSISFANTTLDELKESFQRGGTPNFEDLRLEETWVCQTFKAAQRQSKKKTKRGYTTLEFKLVQSKENVQAESSLIRFKNTGDMAIGKVVSTDEGLVGSRRRRDSDPTKFYIRVNERRLYIEEVYNLLGEGYSLGSPLGRHSTKKGRVRSYSICMVNSDELQRYEGIKKLRKSMKSSCVK